MRLGRSVWTRGALALGVGSLLLLGLRWGTGRPDEGLGQYFGWHVGALSSGSEGPIGDDGAERGEKSSRSGDGSRAVGMAAAGPLAIEGGRLEGDYLRDDYGARSAVLEEGGQGGQGNEEEDAARSADRVSRGNSGTTMRLEGFSSVMDAWSFAEGGVFDSRRKVRDGFVRDYSRREIGSGEVPVEDGGSMFIATKRRKGEDEDFSRMEEKRLRVEWPSQESLVDSRRRQREGEEIFEKTQDTKGDPTEGFSIGSTEDQSEEKIVVREEGESDDFGIDTAAQDKAWNDSSANTENNTSNKSEARSKNRGRSTVENTIRKLVATKESTRSLTNSREEGDEFQQPAGRSSNVSLVQGLEWEKRIPENGVPKNLRADRSIDDGKSFTAKGVAASRTKRSRQDDSYVAEEAPKDFTGMREDQRPVFFRQDREQVLSSAKRHAKAIDGHKELLREGDRRLGLGGGKREIILRNWLLRTLAPSAGSQRTKARPRNPHRPTPRVHAKAGDPRNERLERNSSKGKDNRASSTSEMRERRRERKDLMVIHNGVSLAHREEYPERSLRSILEKERSPADMMIEHELAGSKVSLGSRRERSEVEEEIQSARRKRYSNYYSPQSATPMAYVHIQPAYPVPAAPPANRKCVRCMVVYKPCPTQARPPPRIVMPTYRYQEPASKWRGLKYGECTLAKSAHN
ncbi:hypothetical protein KM043_014224 [Ampulex compressa]|nr:hypothetical protein KM043_014224 [Ampulex compressa]